MTEVLETGTPDLFRTAVSRAAQLLGAGQLVALPTETVYGLAANAFDAKAVASIFVAKGRPSTNPIIVHVSSLDMARRCVKEWTPLAQRMAQAFWPGPLTLVLEKSDIIPDVVTAGGPTVGVRWPSHPIIQAVIESCGFPLAAPSANPSNEVSPTTAQHVAQSLHGRIPLVVDGGASRVGIESTVLDLVSKPPRLLRPGMIDAGALLAVLGKEGLRLNEGSKSEESGALRSPGMLKRHYSPKARLLILNWRDEGDLAAQILERTGVANPAIALNQCHIIAHTRIPSGFGRVCVLPREPGAYARSLYAELHRSDTLGARVIAVEAPPPGEVWRGIVDRLARASAQ